MLVLDSGARASTITFTERGTKALAEAYLQFLYTPEGQEIAAKNFYRPRDVGVAAKYKDKFPKLAIFSVDDVFGGWKSAQETYFAEGGLFDQIYRE